jgi:hypothetical protein
MMGGSSTQMAGLGAFRPLPCIPAKVPDRTDSRRSRLSVGTGQNAPKATISLSVANSENRSGSRLP